MSRVSTYLDFPRNTEEVINFYKSVLGDDFVAPGIMRFSDIPLTDGAPILEAEQISMVSGGCLMVRKK